MNNFLKIIKIKHVRRLIITAIVFILIFSGFYCSFFTLQGVKGDKIIGEHSSPDGNYTVTAYLNNGGATTDFAVLCTVKKRGKSKEKNIYWNYHCSKADIIWLDEKTVSINGMSLDVTKDTYDFRKN